MFAKIFENLEEFLLLKEVIRIDFMSKIPRKTQENDYQYLDRFDKCINYISIIKFFEKKYNAFSKHIRCNMDDINKAIENVDEKIIDNCVESLYIIAGVNNLDEWKI